MVAAKLSDSFIESQGEKRAATLLSDQSDLDWLQCQHAMNASDQTSASVQQKIDP